MPKTASLAAGMAIIALSGIVATVGEEREALRCKDCGYVTLLDLPAGDCPDCGATEWEFGYSVTPV